MSTYIQFAAIKFRNNMAYRFSEYCSEFFGVLVYIQGFVWRR